MNLSAYASDSNRLSASVNPLGHRTTYTYNLAGEQVTIIDARGNMIEFGYDLAGRQKWIENEQGAMERTQGSLSGRNRTKVNFRAPRLDLRQDS